MLPQKNGQDPQLNSNFLVTRFARFEVRLLHVYLTDVRAWLFRCGPMETLSPSQITVFWEATTFWWKLTNIWEEYFASIFAASRTAVLAPTSFIRTLQKEDFCWFLARQPQMDQGLFIHEASRSHSDTPQSVGLLWSSDQPNAETSTWQHTTLTTNIPNPRGIRTHNFSRRAAADPRLRPRGHWDRIGEDYWCKIRKSARRGHLYEVHG